LLALIAALIAVPAPADTTTIAGARGAGVPALDALREAAVAYPELDRRLPGCWSDLTPSIIASYQVWHGPDDERPALVLAGAIDRASLEKCVEKTLRRLRASPRLLRSGAVTEIRNERFDRSYLGWTPWFVVWHRDRARVQQLLSAAGMKTIPPALAAALGRADWSATYWCVATLDLSAGLWGIPARSLSFAVRTRWTLGDDDAKPGLVATFEYASAEEAKRAAMILRSRGLDAARSADARKLAQEARPTVRDRLLDVQVDFHDFDTLGAAMRLLRPP
jgi:hypothetical protein